MIPPINTPADAPELETVRAEQKFLGSALIDSVFCADAVEKGSRDLFFDPLHQRIFDAICELRGRGEKVTVLTIRERMTGDPGLRELSRSPALKDHGGCYLALIGRDASGVIGDPGDYLDILRQAKIGRDAAIAGGADPHQGERRDGLWLESASDIAQAPVEWIWPGRIARGKMTLLAGDPGLGKSQIALDVIARITQGAFWPDSGSAPTGSCIILSAEDAANDTLCPRLDLAGANLKRVQIARSVHTEGMQRSFSLDSDLALLGERVGQIGDVAMILMDPITAYLGGVDSHRTTDVRGVLEPLDRFAEEYQVGLLSITHPPKAAQSKAIHAFTGSLAFVAAARLAFIAVEEPETERSLLLPVKNNLGPKAEGLGYRVQPGTTSRGIACSHVIWDSAPVTVTANEAIHASSSENRRGADLREAEEFLRDRLAAGPVSAEEGKAAALAEGISIRTLDRARSRLGVLAVKNGFDGGWSWKLPSA